MLMIPVVSTTVHSVGYDNATRTMHLLFHSGGLYEYSDVSPDLAADMRRPHPWSRLGPQVRSHNFRQLD